MKKWVDEQIDRLLEKFKALSARMKKMGFRYARERHSRDSDLTA